jgi:hypothetical protein
MNKIVAWLLGGVALGAASGAVQGAELSAQMSARDIKKAIDLVGQSAYHRSFTAHGVPNLGLGLDLGLESTFVFRGALNDLGNAAGVAPRVIPVPRFWMSWDLPLDFMFSANFGPGFLFDGISTGGFGVQWKYLTNPDWASHVSFLFHYGYANAFGDLNAHNIGLDAQVSRDLVLWQPYAGIGVVSTIGSVASRIAAAGVDSGTYGRFALHYFAGARVDLVAKLSFQVDFFNTRPGISILLANSF